MSEETKNPSGTNRRDFIKSGMVGTAALAAVMAPGSASAETTASAAAPLAVAEGKFKVIDFRVRPPLNPFKVLFDLKLSRLEFENKWDAPIPNAVAPSMYKVGKPEGIDLLMDEVNAAGVDYFVMPGRKVSKVPDAVLAAGGSTEMIVDDAALLGLQKTFDNRAFGLHGLDLDLPTAELVAGFENAIKKHKLPGAVMEPGYFMTSKGEVLNADNKKLYPLYETAIKHDVFIMHQSGIFAGPDIGANDWSPLDRVLQAFPKLKLLLAHGGYPMITQALSLAVKHPNFYISPDVYCFFPSGQQYIDAISMLPDQFIHASAYPLGGMKESVEGALRFPLSKEVMTKYLYTNAARLLKLV
jgi:predicted TIM-barrel fold metal-dependent hydrolase